jgi:hypothetical protein
VSDVSLETGTSNQCNNGPSANLANNGPCNTQSFAYQPGGSVFVRAQAPLANPVGGSCGTPIVQQSVPPASFQQHGRACGLTGFIGSGCSGSDRCIPPIGGGFGACVEAPGVQACPSGFPKQHLAGTGISDARGCATCSCGITVRSCSPTTLRVYSATSSCNNQPAPLTANGQCVQWPYQALKIDSYGMSSSPLGTQCTPQNGFGPTGSATLTSPVTICCQ